MLKHYWLVLLTFYLLIFNLDKDNLTQFQIILTVLIDKSNIIKPVLAVNKLTLLTANRNK